MSSEFDQLLSQKPARPAPKIINLKTISLNLLTIFMLLASIVACLSFFVFLIKPDQEGNSFSLGSVLAKSGTATWTPVSYDSTWTPTLTTAPTATFTPRPTYTLLPSATIYMLPTSLSKQTPTRQMTPTRTPRPTGAPYSLVVTYYESTTFLPDSSCSSLFVAGQSLDAQKNPLIGLVVKVGGSLAGKVFMPPLITLTGTDINLGQSGFKLDLGTGPVASNSTLWVQLFDQSNTPLSEQVKLTTYADCHKNLIYVRFQKK